jgi:hypothetical protein
LIPQFFQMKILIYRLMKLKTCYNDDGNNLHFYYFFSLTVKSNKRRSHASLSLTQSWQREVFQLKIYLAILKLCINFEINLIPRHFPFSFCILCRRLLFSLVISYGIMRMEINKWNWIFSLVYVRRFNFHKNKLEWVVLWLRGWEFGIL